MIKFKGSLSFEFLFNDFFFKEIKGVLRNLSYRLTDEGKLGVNEYNFELKGVESYKVDAPNWIVEELENDFLS